MTGMVTERMRLIGGRLVDPSQGIDDLADVVVGSGRVVEIVRGGWRVQRSAPAWIEVTERHICDGSRPRGGQTSHVP